VRDGRGVDTRYVLNGNGGDLERHEAVGSPLERVTVSEWAETDVFKVRTTDPAGRVTEFGHDASGNLTSEEVHTPDLGVVRRSWVYGPFNKLVSETDAASRTTTWEIDAANGDVLSKTDAVGNATRFEYDGARGLLLREIDPRGHVTEHSDHDSFGNARTLRAPEGRVVQRTFDARGRSLGEEDNQGHAVTQVWDGLDRVVSRRRVSGAGTASDERYAWEYYPGGQKRVETNPMGARTEFTLDELDRVVLESTTVGGEVLTVERSYDANGNVLVERDRRGVRKAWTYDDLNRATEIRILDGPAPGPVGVVARFGYDSVDRRLFEEDLAGRRSDLEYDGLYRVTRKLLPETCPYGRCAEEYRYDLVGNRTLFRDHGLRTEVSVYDGLNRVISFTDRAGRTRTSEYEDPEGSHVNKSVDHDPFGLVTAYAYDELNRETSRIVSLTGGGSQGEVYTTLTEYEDGSHAIVVTDPRGTRTRRVLDGLDRVTRQIVDVGGLGLESRFTWNGLSNQTASQDPEGHVTESSYDALGRLREVEDPLHRRAAYAYDGGGFRVSETDRRGVRTDLSYDNVGRLVRTSVVPSLTAVPWSVSTAYLDQARRRVLTDPRGKQTTIELDGLDRPVRTVDPEGQETRTEWLGSQDRRERDKRGFWRELRFDGVGRPTLVRDPAPFDAQTVVTIYDDAANRVTETDRRGIARVTQNDSLQRLRSTTRAGVLLEEHSYDGNGNRVASMDAAGRQTRFDYDPANRLTARTDGFGGPDATITRYEHDRDGNVTLERDQRAADLGEPFSIHRTFDALHRVTTMTDGEAHVTAYGYDEEGHRTSVTEPGLQVTTFDYGEKGELTLVRQPAGSTHGQPETRVGYDAARNPLRQTDGRGHHVDFLWDDLGRLDTRTQRGAPEGDLVTDPTYDANGNQIALVDPKGQTVTQTFDELNRLQTKTWAFAPEDPYRPWRHTVSMTYTWDPNNNLTRVDEAAASGSDPPSQTLSTIRTYDDLDRMTSEPRPSPTAACCAR
jgi:YD repeat-containing protein